MSCGNCESSCNCKIGKISAQELKLVIEKSGELKLINVLAEDFYKDCSIANSINIPLGELESMTSDWNRSQEIVVYCANYTCNASKKAYEVLHKMGFTNLRAYEGGTKEWKEQGFSVEGSCEKSYLN
jgi:rhodanese-related sulfurtransferase